MSSSVSFHSLKLNDLKSLIGSKRGDIKDRLIGDDPEGSQFIDQLIDEGNIDGIDYYPAYLLEFVNHENIDDSWANQAYWDLIEKLVTNPEVNQELTDLLSYITEGRRVTDGERFHQMGDQYETTVGYWTVEEIKKLKELLNNLDKSFLGDLGRVVDSLKLVCKKTIEKNEDVFFVSA
ncbi:MAG TPA: hypothetical protein DEB09_05290 [Candidatus Magasanikbacteria bacterium]|nr:hypothetical protein [Candidatus Magasanikbacteria bacterium]